jgi:putative membrane protein
MIRHSASRHLLASSLVLAAALTACGRPRNDTAQARDTSAMTGSASGRAPSDSALSDQDIASIVMAANTLDSTNGALARGKTSNSTVRQFGERMVREHGQLNQQVKSLGRRLNLTPGENEKVREMRNDAQDKIRDLSSKTGAEFDHAYIDAEIDMHEHVIDALDHQLIPGADNADLRNLLTQARAAVQSHLDQARTIKQTLH